MDGSNKIRGVYGGSMDYYDNKLYVFGGFATPYTFSNMMTVYNFNDNIFKGITSSNPPPTGRACHETCIYKHYIVLFGGSAGYAGCNDLYLYDIIKNTWSLYIVINRPKYRYDIWIVIYIVH